MTPFVETSRYAAFKVQIDRINEIANSSPAQDILDVKDLLEQAEILLRGAFADELVQHAADNTLAEH